MPGEAQKIERLMEVFSRRYCGCNPDVARLVLSSVFHKNTFFKKNKGIPPRVPLGRSESFFRLDKSKGSNQLMKNEGFLHCRFSLSPLMATLRAGQVKIYNVKTHHFSLTG